MGGFEGKLDSEEALEDPSSRSYTMLNISRLEVVYMRLWTSSGWGDYHLEVTGSSSCGKGLWRLLSCILHPACYPIILSWKAKGITGINLTMWDDRIILLSISAAVTS